MKMKKIILVGIVALGCLMTAFAKQLSCPSYLGNEGNVLFNVGIVGTQMDHYDEEKIEDIMPDREVQHDDLWVQYFYPKQHKNYKKLFVLCVYKDNKSFVEEISNVYRQCIKKYSTKSIVLDFSCF